MASLNLSTNSTSISKSYQSVVNAPPPTGAAASSPTYAQWAVYAVSAPLANAFQQGSANKESTLKVQSTGGRELQPQNFGRLLNHSRGRISGSHRRILRRPNPVCLRQSQGHKHWSSKVRFDRMVRGGCTGADEGLLRGPYGCSRKIATCEVHISTLQI